MAKKITNKKEDSNCDLVCESKNEALKKSEAMLKEAQRVGHFGNWDWDAVTDTITWSEEYYHIFGFDPKKKPPKYEEHLKIYMPESAARLDAAVKKNMQTGEPYELDLEIAKPVSGACRWITARSETKRDASGKIIGLRGTAQNITARKLAEEKLKASEEKYSTLVEKGNDGILIIQGAGILKYVNSIICGMTGYSKEESLGKSFLDYVSPDYKKLVAERYEKRLKGIDEPNKYEIEILSKDGKITPVEVNASQIKYEGAPAVMAIVRDIADRKRAEKTLKERNEELEKMNRLMIGREVKMTEIKEELEKCRCSK